MRLQIGTTSEEVRSCAYRMRLRSGNRYVTGRRPDCKPLAVAEPDPDSFWRRNRTPDTGQLLRAARPQQTRRERPFFAGFLAKARKPKQIEERDTQGAQLEIRALTNSAIFSQSPARRMPSMDNSASAPIYCNFVSIS